MENFKGRNRAQGLVSLAETPPTKKRQAWTDQLAAMTSVAKDGPVGAREVVDRLVSLNNRVPLTVARRCFTPQELAIYRRIGEEILLYADSPTTYSSTHNVVCLCLSPYGKVSLYLLQDESPSIEESVVGYFVMSADALKQVSGVVNDIELAERTARAELHSYLEAWQASGALESRVGDVLKWTDRVDNILIYVGRDVYSRTDIGTSTLRSDRFKTLHELPPSQWSASDRLFISSVQVLFAAGRAYRLEEFNGCQLSALSLIEWLRSSFQRYCSASSEIATSAPVNKVWNFLGLAMSVKQGAKMVDSSPSAIRYRKISGPFFNKSEAILELAAADRVLKAVPNNFSSFWRNRQATGSEMTVEEYVVRLREEVSSLSGDARSAVVENTLQAIVRAAIRDCSADYGMTSGVRDLEFLDVERAGSFDAVAKHGKKDFFCCTLPSVELERSVDSQPLSDMLLQVAQRMQYNRWHFVPGDFADPDIPKGRHIFYPPMLPDLAEHSDLRHGGHVAANVRYSIRIPGPAAWRQPLRVGNEAYRGCFDLRLVRMRGPAFSTGDLIKAIRLADLLDRVWRLLAELHESPHQVPVRVRSFSSDWYRRNDWSSVGAK